MAYSALSFKSLSESQAGKSADKVSILIAEKIKTWMKIPGKIEHELAQAETAKIISPQGRMVLSKFFELTNKGVHGRVLKGSPTRPLKQIGDELGKTNKEVYEILGSGMNNFNRYVKSTIICPSCGKSHP